MTPRACASEFRTTSKKPKRRDSVFRRLRIAAALALLCGCCGSPPGTARSAPRRVVTLAPNLTEIVFALGAQDCLLAVSDFSDYPSAARRLPRVGGLDTGAERIASMRPDLVLASRDGNARGVVGALEGAGIPVVTVSGESLDAVLLGIRQVAARLGRRTEGERLIAELSRRRSAVRERVSRRPRPAAILLVWPDPPQAAGGGTFLADVLEEAGARNLLSGRPGWPVVSPEFLATAAIDILVIPDSRETRGAFERAFREGALARGRAAAARVVRVEESALTRPGPRVFDALEALADRLHPATAVGPP